MVRRHPLDPRGLPPRPLRSPTEPDSSKRPARSGSVGSPYDSTLAPSSPSATGGLAPLSPVTDAAATGCGGGGWRTG